MLSIFIMNWPSSQFTCWAHHGRMGPRQNDDLIIVRLPRAVEVSNTCSYFSGCYLSETNCSSTSSPWRISARCMVPPRSSARRSCRSPARNATQTDPIFLPTTPLQLLMTQYLLIYRAPLTARTPIHPNFMENFQAKPTSKKSRITPTLSSHRPIPLRPSRDWTHLEAQTAIPAQAVVWHCQIM